MKNIQTTAYRLFKKTAMSLAFIVTTLSISAYGFVTASGESDLMTAQAAQNALSGEWTAEFKRSKIGEIQFTFHRRSEKGGMSMTGDTLSLNEFQGLSQEIASSARANVNFNIVREAGVFACEGFFREGKGAGFWSLTPNQTFVSAMRGRGYESLTDEDLLRAALHNLTTKYVDDLKSAGYERLDFKQLNRAATHNITPQFIREMQSAGYQGLTMDELIRARSHNINGEYVKEVRAMGFDKQPLATLIRLRSHEITQEFINQMRSAGFENLSIEQLIRLKNHNITPDFVNDVKAEGYAQITPETAVRLKNHNVDRDFIRRVKAKGFTDISLEQIIRLRNHNIVQ
jgi:uncharacterized protein (UPF0335 family)